MRYSLNSVEEMALNIKVTGFSDKIFEFTKIYIEEMLSCAEDGFDRADVLQSIEKIKVEYTNNIAGGEDLAVHNRLLMLIPHTYHDKRVEKEL